MKKIITLLSLSTLLMGCSSVMGDNEYKLVDVEVVKSKSVHKICIPERNLNDLEYYHPDFKNRNFFAYNERDSDGHVYWCKRGGYRTEIEFNHPMTNRFITGTVITDDRYRRTEHITIMHRVRK